MARSLIQSIHETGGATFDARGQAVDSGDLWVYPLHPGRTLILDARCDWETPLLGFVEKHGPLLEPGDREWRAFGAWLHSSGQLYLDIVTGRPTREEAIHEALAAGKREGRQILALYRASTGDTLTLHADP